MREKNIDNMIREIKMVNGFKRAVKLLEKILKQAFTYAANTVKTEEIKAQFFTIVNSLLIDIND